ncbi:MAG: hypothetical protein H6739_19510 [Alphaproteobacteria bacterium]|nr:hypothetical protein [Alphaproteobacteria bacterium]
MVLLFNVFIVLLTACNPFAPEPPAETVSAPQTAYREETPTWTARDDSAAPAPSQVDDPMCEATYPTDGPRGPGCLSGVLSCGDVLTATTQGGSEVYGAEFYGAMYCFPTYGDFNAAERVYALELPAGTLATLHLSSPCVELSIAVARWEQRESCPTAAHLIAECEGIAGVNAGTVGPIYAQRASRYLVSVDGPAGAEGPFSLQVDCRTTHGP